MTGGVPIGMPATRGDLRDAFEADGYVVLHAALPLDTVDACAAALAVLRERHPDVNVPATAPARERFEGMDRMVQHAYSEPAVETIALASSVQEVLRRILGREPVARLTRLLAQSPGALDVNAERRGTPHLHNFGMATRPAGLRAIAWTPVDDVDPDAGPMWVLPGSHVTFADFPDHLLNSVPGARDWLHEHWAKGASAESWLAWHGALGERSMAILADWMDATEARPVPVLLRRGDVLIFSNDLLHGTWRANDPSLPRRILFTHYHAEGCELWEIGDAVGADVNPAGPECWREPAAVRHERGLIDPGGFRRFYASMRGFFG